MKANLYYFSTLAVAMGLTACGKEGEADLAPQSAKTMSVVAKSNGDVLRTALQANGDNFDVVWSANDQIKIGGSTFTIQEGVNTTTGTFTGTATLPVGPCMAWYAMDENNWPATQTYVEGKISNAPMAAKVDIAAGTTEVKNLSFKNLGGLLHLKVKGTEKIKSITISANEEMAGSCNISWNDNIPEVTIPGSNTSNKFITLNCEDGVQLTEEGTDFYIAMPENNYSGVTIAFTRSDNKVCTKTLTGKRLNITRAKITDATLRAASFLPTTGTAKATIGDNQVDVKWVQLWAGGPKFAEYNVGASSSTRVGTTMTFIKACKTGTEYVWGTNWCTPSKEDMEELVNAASSTGSGKVTCEYIQEKGVFGFKFTGSETDYKTNSVFFRVQVGDGDSGYAYYWSSSADGDSGYVMTLGYLRGHCHNAWFSSSQGYEYLVRPVLRNAE